MRMLSRIMIRMNTIKDMNKARIIMVEMEVMGAVTMVAVMMAVVETSRLGSSFSRC